MAERNHDHRQAAPSPSKALGAAALTGRHKVDAQNPTGVFPEPPLALSIDWRFYEHHLAGADLTEQEKREFIEALWYIIVSFVDLGFGIEPVNHALKAAAMSDLRPLNADAGTAKHASAKTDAITNANNKEITREGTENGV